VHYLTTKGLPMKPRVLLTSYYNREIIDSSLEPLRQIATLVDGNRNRNWTLDEMLAEIPGIHATVAADEPYTREVFERADELLVVARDGTGFDKIDVQAATDHGIIVTRAPVVIDATANLTIGLMIALVRKITTGDHAVRNGQWVDRSALLCPDLTGMTLGIVGLGPVGRKVATRAKALGMQVLAYNRTPLPDIADDLGVELVAFEALTERADIVSVHLQSSPETRGLCDAVFFANMKAGSYFINTARGQIIDELALVAALQTGHLAGAALDVFETEPIPADNPLSAMDNVVLTPHVGGDTSTTMIAAINMNVTQITDLLTDRKPSNMLNPEVWDHARCRKT
ncbi:MAG: NAD(P)-dependent oxidoreductase, partial [Lentisphaeria bacterium]|nr:NAD(P)-dependent oxidoreductase [Lentisphaeria bacterium]